MGGGLTFLSKKSFNPSNFSNQRRVWEARQNSESERRRIVEREAQIKREREEEELARVVGGEEEGGRKALGFMYDGGKIPGLKKEGNGNNNQDDDEHESKSNRNDGVDETSLFQRQPGDDDAAAAFRAMLAQGVDDDTDKQRVETSQHDNIMTNAQTTHEAAEDDSNNNGNEATDNRTKLEKAVGRGINSGSGVTLAQQMERFPMLKGAPMVVQKQKNMGGDGEKNEQASTATGINFKPLGQVLRNVQCMACKKWGHARGERECELSGWDPFRINAPAAATAATTASAAPNNTAAAETSRGTAIAIRPDHNKLEAEPTRQKSERKHKKRRKDHRHEKKKKSKKHKRRRRERSPSYSSDSFSSSSYDSYSSEEERYKRRRRDYRSDDSDSRRRSRKGRRKKSSRR
mmetsp:Transcript_14820/g.22894  ORF Transcript_14820/g.22894 Transcript_14820/m.22894 type:complete len:404 (+) Transcript_14820:119-1330(+)